VPVPLLDLQSQTMKANDMKVAVVHDWLVIYGGAERVLEHILDCYPQADLFSLIFDVPEDQRHFLRGKTPTTSFLQRLPGAKKRYRKLLPLMPYAIEQLDVTGYDLVLSSSYAVAKGVLTGPNQLHVCYCHSPMRYAWDHYHFYLEATGLDKGLRSLFARWQLHKVRNWDARNSLSVDRFLTSSRFVRERIWKCYRREAEVLHPPIDTSLFQLHEPKEDFYVAAGRFVPFKRIDLAAEAFASMPEKKLILVGDGPEMDNIRKKCGPNVECIGFQPPEVMRDHLSRAKAFIFPSEEDFGIVPVEAQACGTPVIAFARGGALETVVSPEAAAARGVSPTGLFFEEQSAASLADAVRRFESMPGVFSAPAIAQHAASFAPENFKHDLMAHVDAAWAEKRARMAR
jgi:glycosyltransferase involved in cell wall biosynthesis